MKAYNIGDTSVLEMADTDEPTPGCLLTEA